jgi:dCMP deaminase
LKEKYIIAHMKTAQVYAELSTAVRLQVGCVIVKDNTIIGIGYNGMPSGWDNVCETVKFKDFTGTVLMKSKPEVLHAETNAIAKVSRSNNSTDSADLFVTHAPCLECAKLIYQSGIKSVFYRDTYRSEDGIQFLQKCNVEVKQIGQ